ncbi:uncharacterized protein N7483_000247 [Penicillium malachiteum]|uniref:uncharacterized protein n=1 Tax=Penicillium malachiteum TaxID=1324776 RepID=UPI002546C3A9|nr:uncharacterized protein N7483_000247 [Penicillium malachiteum]KAJ5735122.1 hypothetical protein N7483_000247 [Penicillium malachiteum]
MDDIPFQEYPDTTQRIQLPVHDAPSQAIAYNQPTMENQGQTSHHAQVSSERRRSLVEQEMIEGFRENAGQFERRNAAVERLAARERERTARQSRHSSAQTRLIAEHITRVEAARRSEQVQYQRNLQHLDSSSSRGITRVVLDRQELVTVFEEAFYNLREYSHGYRNYQAPPSSPSTSTSLSLSLSPSRALHFGSSEGGDSQSFHLTGSSPERGRSPTPRTRRLS